MLKSIFKQIGIGDARPTTINLQLADKSICHTERTVDNVLVRVDKFIFPTDFIILNFEVDEKIPIILRRPFLATERTTVSTKRGGQYKSE